MRLLLLPLLLTVPLLAAETNSRSVGSPNAPVVLEVYSDFQCPHCKDLHFGALKEAIGDCVAAGKVRIVYRDYPLPQHKYAWEAARYANAAARIGLYEKVCDELFLRQDDWGKTGKVDETVAKILSPADMAKVRKEIKDPKIDAEIEADQMLGAKVPLQQTPTMVLSSKTKTYPIAGNISYYILKLNIDSFSK